MPRNKVKMAETKVSKPKPWWWKPLWIGTILLTIISGVVTYFLFDVPLARAVLGLILTFLAIGFAYYIRVKPSMRVNRAIYMFLGASLAEVTTLFGGGFVILVTGLPPPTHYLGSEISFILILIAPWIIGAFIGDWIGKRRNYILPLTP
jgi:hypothetical protein